MSNNNKKTYTVSVSNDQFQGIVRTVGRSLEFCPGGDAEGIVITGISRVTEDHGTWIFTFGSYGEFHVPVCPSASFDRHAQQTLNAVAEAIAEAKAKAKAAAIAKAEAAKIASMTRKELAAYRRSQAQAAIQARTEAAQQAADLRIEKREARIAELKAMGWQRLLAYAAAVYNIVGVGRTRTSVIDDILSEEGVRAA